MPLPAFVEVRELLRGQPLQVLRRIDAVEHADLDDVAFVLDALRENRTNVTLPRFALGCRSRVVSRPC